MAWENDSFTYFHSGESRDPVSSLLPAGVSIQTARVKTGSRGFLFDSSAGSTELLGVSQIHTGGVNSIIAMSGHFSLTAAPSSEIPLCIAAGGNGRLVTIGTDRKLRFYDHNENQVGSATPSTIPTSGLQEITIFWDGRTLGTIWISVFFGTTEDLSFDTGKTWTAFFGNEGTIVWSAGSTGGTTLYADDLYGNRSFTDGDAPHLAAYPRHLGDGLANLTPDGEGDVTDWDSDPAAPNSDDAVDETPHDGDTSYVNTDVGLERHLLKCSTANILPNPCVPVKVQLRDVGRMLGDNKLGARFMVRLSGTDAISGAIGDACHLSTDFHGHVNYDMDRPGGKPWGRTDFNANILQFGWKSESAAVLSVGPRVTQQLGPEIVFYVAADVIPTGNVTDPVSAPRSLLYRPDRAMRPLIVR